MNAALRRAAHLQFTLRNLIEPLMRRGWFGHETHGGQRYFYARSALLPENVIPGESAALRSIAGSDK